MSAPMTETVHIWASHIPSSPPVPIHDFRIGERAPHPKDAQASEGAWRLYVLGGTVLVESTTDHVKDAGEALRARGDVSQDALVTIYSPSTNVCWSGPLKEM